MTWSASGWRAPGAAEENDARVVDLQIDRNTQLHEISARSTARSAPLRPLGAKDGYILSFETIYEKSKEMLALGGTGILLQAACIRICKIGYYENLLRSPDKRDTRRCICTVFRRRKSCASRK